MCTFRKDRHPSDLEYLDNRLSPTRHEDLNQRKWHIDYKEESTYMAEVIS